MYDKSKFPPIPPHVEQPVPVVVPYVCGNCAAWVPVELKGPVTIGSPKRGYCFGAPPTPIPQYDARGGEIGVRNIRAATLQSERACLLFVPKPELVGTT